MNANVIAQQYSDAVAFAQTGATLDTFAAQLLANFGSYSVPKPIVDTGLTLTQRDGTLLVSVQGQTFQSEIDHIKFETRSTGFQKSGGRVYFSRVVRGEVVGQPIAGIVFDNLGNAGAWSDVSGMSWLNASLNQAADVTELCRQILVGLIDAANTHLAIIPC